MVASDRIPQNEKLDSFSEKFGAVFVKELRQGLRARRFVAPFLTLHALAFLTVVGQLSLEYFAGFDTATASYGLQRIFDSLFDQAFLVLLWLIVGIVMPLTGINALQSELANEKNIDLLLLAGLNRWQIMRGKWLVLCSLSGLILISMFPYMLTLYFTGGVDLLSQVKQLLTLWLFNTLMNAAIIGSSGYRHILLRALVIGLIFFSCLVSALTIFISIPLGASSFSAGILIGQMISAINHLLLALLYVIYSLQLGRSSLRLYERPLDPPLTGLIIIYIIFTPVALGIFRLIGGSPGSMFGLAVGIFIALVIDRSSKKQGNTPYAQP